MLNSRVLLIQLIGQELAKRHAIVAAGISGGHCPDHARYLAEVAKLQTLDEVAIIAAQVEAEFYGETTKKDD